MPPIFLTPAQTPATAAEITACTKFIKAAESRWVAAAAAALIADAEEATDAQKEKEVARFKAFEVDSTAAAKAIALAAGW